MPVGKTTKKKLQQNKSSTLDTATQSVHDVTVRDCLLWPDDHKKQPTTTSHDDVVYVSLRQQQQQQQCKSSTQVRQVCKSITQVRQQCKSSTQVRQVSKSSTQVRQVCKSSTQVRQVRVAPEDDDRVSDALRGWPRHMIRCEQVQQQQQSDDDGHRDICKQAPTKTKTGQATKDVKSKSKGNATKDKDEDIHVADLIAQRFLHEYMEQRETEMERDRKKKEAREIAAREGRRAAKDRTDIKANKAAQLRAIALADRVEVSPYDLWKMDKFTRSARPHVSTFRNGQVPSGASASGAGGASNRRRGLGVSSRGGYGGRSSSGGGFSGRSSEAYEDDEFVGACTCPDKLSYYDGYDVYDTYHECADRCLTTDVDNFRDAADCVYSYVETSSSPISAL